jgi:hypothetical protein
MNWPTRRTRAFLSALVAALAVTAGIAATAGTASAQSATVLINYPGCPNVCRVGDNLTVGVWYQAISGGAHGYWVGVYNDQGKRVFMRSGSATTTWKLWNIRLTQAGHYTTIYATDGVKQGYRTNVAK